MEEVVSSNLTRSTKTFQTLTNEALLKDRALESKWSPKMDSAIDVTEVLASVRKRVWNFSISSGALSSYKDPTNPTIQL